MKAFVRELADNLFAYRIGMATLILIAVFIIGSVGFHLIEGMNFFDGFYMTFITISTIGFREIADLSVEGRVFTVIIFVMGVGVISYIASQSTQLLFESELFFKRAMKSKLQKIKNHYIICGYGRIGHRIAEVLRDANLPVVVVERRESSLEKITQDGLLYVEGNAQEEELLVEAGIKRARGLICALSNDQDNVFTTLIARELNPDIFILVRTNEQKNERKIMRAGADKVISPYEIGADRMANVILRPNVDQFIQSLTNGVSEDHAFEEVKVFEGSEMAGKTLSDIHVRARYFIVIIAIIRAGEDEVKFNPGGHDTIHVGDSLIVLGDRQKIQEFRTEACKDNREPAERIE